MEFFKHEHPLTLIDLQPSYPEYEVVYSDEEEEDEKEKEEVSITKQDFRCPCDGCGQEINYIHRYYYRCDQCNYSLHKCCGEELPETLEYASHPRCTLTLSRSYHQYWCSVCRKDQNPGLHYLFVGFEIVMIDLQCAAKELVKKEIIYHPSHRHPLMPISREILSNYDACGKKHEGTFYQCTARHNFLIHKDWAFLPKKLLIQHTHPLTLTYSFPIKEQEDKNYPECRLCSEYFSSFKNDSLWIYKCDKCRYYAHLDCATSRKEPFMSIFMKPGTGILSKNFKDDDYPDLLRLPFPDQTYSILKHLFFKEIKPSIETKELNIRAHRHPLILVNEQSPRPTSSRTFISPSCHDPMKNVQLLCNGCFRPIMSFPFYKCACDREDQRCNFVLHEWCTRLPSELKDHPCHPQHTLTLLTHVPQKISVFYCAICCLHCNGFAYSCVECEFYIDVGCAFIPEKITHEAHPDHLLSRSRVKENYVSCRMCMLRSSSFSWSCLACDFHLHAACALLLPQTIRHKVDKHPMKLSYVPIENHKSDYFCEVCEEDLNPRMSFYHCHECAWSVHSYCAPSILQCERITYPYFKEGVYIFVNIKFGGVHKIESHPHPLTFLQGIETDGRCYSCHGSLKGSLVFKCYQCKFTVHPWCYEE